MKILALSDIHGFYDIYRRIPELVEKNRADALVLAGDLLGVPDGFATIEKAQRESARVILDLLLPVKIPVFYIMGNDDLVELQSTNDQFQSLHGRRVNVGAFNFVGYQYSLTWMGGIFEKSEEEIEKDLSHLEKYLDNATVLVTHSPAFGILDVGVLDNHAGSSSILAIVKRRSVRAHIHGHIHRCFGRQDLHFNVAAAGRLRGMIIDLGTMRHDVFSGNISGGEE